MPNAAAHKAGSAIAVGGAFAIHQYMKNGQVDWKALVAAWTAGQLGSIPDMLEPAIHPNHRAFFHSFVFLGLVGYGTYRLYKWETEDDFEKVLKWLGIIAGGSITAHLAMDFTTKKSLPLA